jgi:hypothetical protein
MIALGNFNAWILVPCVSLAFETKNPAYAALVCLSLVQVFWAARHIYSDFQEAKYPGMQTGITKAMRVAATLLVVPMILYSWHAYSSLATKA